jgi:hypothetical protein
MILPSAQVLPSNCPKPTPLTFLRRLVLSAALSFLTTAPVTAVEYNDNFANGLDETHWKFVSNQPLFTIDDSGGDIHISKPEGGDGIDEDYGQICFMRDLLGDFDIGFDASEILVNDMDPDGNNTAAIALMFGGQYFYMGRNDEGADGNGHVAGVWIDPPGVWPDDWYWTPQEETEGRFRVTRVGTRVVGTFNDTLIYDGDFNDGQVTRLCLGTANNWSTDPLSVRIDNVAIVADDWSPAIEKAKFAGSDTNRWDEFGNPMAISGDTLVVAAQWANDVWRSTYRGTGGTVYVYKRSAEIPEGWQQVASLTPDEDAEILRYGMGLAIDGDVLAIGTEMACNDQSLHYAYCDAGVVHIYERSGSDPGNWQRVAEFIGDGRTDWYGFPLSLSGETLAVGAHWEGSGTVETVPGAVHIYQRNSGGTGIWGEVAVLSASDGADDDWFGLALALSGDTIAVGAPAADVVCPGDPYCDSGAVYIYERNHGGPDAWGEVIKITPDDADFDDLFGFDVALAGDTLLVANLTAEDRKGTAYFFERDHGGPNNWGFVKKVTPTTKYSTKVTLRGDVALLSGNPTVVLGRNRGGAGNWGELAALSPCDEGTIYQSNGFGESGYMWDTHRPFAIDGQHFIVGALGDDERGEDAGAAYVFEVSQSEPPQIIRFRRPAARRGPR